MNEESRPRQAAPKSLDSDTPRVAKPWRQSPHDAYRERRRQEFFELHVEPEPRPGPCSYGLTSAELCAEAERLTRMGWSADEIRARLTDPRKVAA